MFESLTDHISGSNWTYVFLFAVSALDAAFLLVPSETSVIAAGVIAASGDLVLPLIILAAALGAFVGDTTSFTIGRFGGPPGGVTRPKVEKRKPGRTGRSARCRSGVAI